MSRAKNRAEILVQNQIADGAPGTIRTSDPQIRSLTQRSGKVRIFCKPVRLPAKRDQRLRSCFANHRSFVQGEKHSKLNITAGGSGFETSPFTPAVAIDWARRAAGASA
jgi:hypothetical protein